MQGGLVTAVKGLPTLDRRRAVSWLGASLALPAWAQPAAPASAPAGATRGVPDPDMSSDLLKTGLYLIQGGGGNVLMRFSASGLILVDGKLPGRHRGLMSHVRRISKITDLPVRVVVLTGPGEDHTGTNPQFIAGRVAVVAPQKLLDRLPEAARPVAPQAIAFDRDYALHMGGVSVQVRHFDAARTGSDSVAFFPDLKVIAVGDLFTTEEPQADVARGGSLSGWSQALTELLALDFDRVVPGHGPVVGRAELADLQVRISSLAARGS
jgi:glyoxylase-like metal-dependent hydrolase (beta-lactamase superfamily II)